MSLAFTAVFITSRAMMMSLLAMMSLTHAHTHSTLRRSYLASSKVSPACWQFMQQFDNIKVYYITCTTHGAGVKRMLRPDIIHLVPIKMDPDQRRGKL